MHIYIYLNVADIPLVHRHMNKRPGPGQASGPRQQYNDQLPADSLQRIRVGDAVAKAGTPPPMVVPHSASRSSGFRLYRLG